MKMVKLTINGKSYEAEQGKTVLEVARENNIWIPTLCYDKRLVPHGGCRICLVEVEGARQLLISCTTQVSDGMVVSTESEKVVRARRGVLDYILSDHPLDCMTCEATGCCELQDVAYKMGVYGQSYRDEFKKGGAIPDRNLLIYRETPKCIRCGRCVRICGEVQQDHAIAFGGRGFKMWVATPFGESLLDGPCVLCGQCISTCPTGALYEKQAMGKGRSFQLRQTRSTCGYCSIGCQIDVNVNYKEITKVTSEVGVSPNNGNLCMKGKFAFDFANHKDRLDSPLVRKEGELVKAGWDEAYEVIANALNDAKSTFGDDSVAFISSGKCTNEENYLLQKFARAVVGTNNIDQSETECHAPTQEVLKNTLGFGTATNPIEDISKADVIFIIGANITETHPIIGLEVKKAVTNGSTLITADTRNIWLKKISKIYLNLKPGTDLQLANALTSTIINEKLYDEGFIKARANGFKEFKEAILKQKSKDVEAVTGISEKTIREVAAAYAKADKAIILYGNGVTQHKTGVDNVKSLVNLALLTGNIGKEGAGIIPLMGQNNGQGAFDMGAVPGFYTDYQPVSNPAVHKKFEKAYKTKLPQNGGLNIREIFNSASKNKIKAIYIMGSDPLMSEPDTAKVEKALKNLNLLVVQDIFMTSTAQYADVVLPAACFAEKDGTFTNIERRVQRVRKAVTPPGTAKPDWQIIAELSNRMGYAMNYHSPEEVWKEIKKLSPNLAGINYNKLENNGGVQWPCPNNGHAGTSFLYGKKFAGGRANFTLTERKQPALEKPNSDYPYILSTGRTLYHFNSGTMTGRAEGSVQKQPYPFVEISQKDAGAAKIKDGDMVRVSTKRGKITLCANITNGVVPGQLWVPIHFISAQANLLIKDTYSAASKTNGSTIHMPAYKMCVANVEKVK